MKDISVAGVGPILQALSQRGIDVDAVLQAHGLAEGRNDSDSWVSLEIVYSLLLQAAEKTGDQDIGLCAYAFSHPGALGAPSYAVMSSPTLGVALERLAKYLVSAVKGSRLVIDKTPEEFRISGIEEGIFPSQTPRCYIDVGASLLLGLIHWLTPQQRPLPITVHLPYPRPVSTLKLEKMFGGDLFFDAKNLTFSFRRETFDLPIITADRSLEAVHCNYADEHLKVIEGALKAKVKKILSYSLAEGQLMSLEQMATYLCMSRRTLQKELSKEFTNFSELQDKCCKELARNLLVYSSKNIKYISSAVGFLELSSFHKACLRWFKTSPAQYRNQHGGVREIKKQ